MTTTKENLAYALVAETCVTPLRYAGKVALAPFEPAAEYLFDMPGEGQE